MMSKKLMRQNFDDCISLAEKYGLSSMTMEEMNFENEIYQKLVEAQAEARSNPRRLSHDEVFRPLRRKIAAYKPSNA
jgi:hypothetical protein